LRAGCHWPVIGDGGGHDQQIVRREIPAVTAPSISAAVSTSILRASGGERHGNRAEDNGCGMSRF
jgi:hypothetical protein